jgi:gamma-glutamyltranspeptidase/glutathione hydrolase
MIRVLFLLALLILPGCATKHAEAALPQKFMVAAAHPLAVEAGLDILRQGGSAVDAAIATQAVLTLVEPESSGIGGGAFLLDWDKASGALTSYDGRETAPKSARATMFLKPDGAPMGYWEAAKSGRAVGIPGVIAMLALAHRDHGLLPWHTLFARAIALAETGFPASPRLAETIAKTPGLDATQAGRARYFTADGKPIAAGTLIKDADLAKTLKLIAEKGPDAFYKGRIARAIITAAATAPHYPTRITAADLTGYKAKTRPPLCGLYRAYKICSMGPPSSGGSTMLALLKLLEPFDLAALKPSAPEALHLIAEASRLAYADRERYLGDPDVVAIPLAGLLDDNYLRGRNALIKRDSTMAKAEAGIPPGATATPPAMSQEGPSTSHMSIVDAKGNAVSMTTTVEGPFGSNLIAAGFVLNNQLTDFSFLPVKDGVAMANAVAPGKRPLSAMAPTIIFAPDGALFAIIGSPGGKRIIAYVAEAVIGLIDWRLDMKSAVGLPHIVAIGDTLELEKGTTLEGKAQALTQLGHHVAVTPLVSNLQGIRFTAKGLDGAADLRREGTALGE